MVASELVSSSTEIPKPDSKVVSTVMQADGAVTTHSEKRSKLGVAIIGVASLVVCGMAAFYFFGRSSASTIPLDEPVAATVAEPEPVAEPVAPLKIEPQIEPAKPEPPEPVITPPAQPEPQVADVPPVEKQVDTDTGPAEEKVAQKATKKKKSHRSRSSKRKSKKDKEKVDQVISKTGRSTPFIDVQ